MPPAPSHGVQTPDTVYLIASASHSEKYYVGITSNLAERLEAHNAGGSRHTSKFRPWRVVGSVTFADAARALRFEKYLKSGSGRAFLTRHFR